jgi:hypothetical protein
LKFVYFYGQNNILNDLEWLCAFYLTKIEKKYFLS